MSHFIDHVSFQYDNVAWSVERSVPCKNSFLIKIIPISCQKIISTAGILLRVNFIQMTFSWRLLFLYQVFRLNYGN